MDSNFSRQDFMDCDNTHASVKGKDTMHYYVKYGRALLNTTRGISYIRGDRMKRIILFVLGLNIVMCFDMAGMVREDSKKSLTKQEIASEDKETWNSIDVLVELIDAKDLELRSLDDSIGQYNSIEKVYLGCFKKLRSSEVYRPSELEMLHRLLVKGANYLMSLHVRKRQISEEKKLLDTFFEELRSMEEPKASASVSERLLMDEHQVSQERAQHISRLEKQLIDVQKQLFVQSCRH